MKKAFQKFLYAKVHPLIVGLTGVAASAGASDVVNNVVTVQAQTAEQAPDIATLAQVVTQLVIAISTLWKLIKGYKKDEPES